MKILRCAFSRPEQIPEGIPACCELFHVKTYFPFLQVPVLLILCGLPNLFVVVFI